MGTWTIHVIIQNRVSHDCLIPLFLGTPLRKKTQTDIVELQYILGVLFT